MEDNPTIPGGEFAGRYIIERELGRGGAAIVYLARDTHQERHVALKVLHRELAQAIGAQRFLREIRHSSALQHPHLLSIHDSGESDGLLYYVMPHMPDGSLRARIAREKQLPTGEAVRITRQVGEALEYAHSRGIVHRDIKPDNILFAGQDACLADFGIARAVDSVAADTLTSTGLVVGTPAYMSPEQASGEKGVDPRSDQYSLACLLYEMITGLPPFIGATQQAVISQRFTQPPPSMRAHRPTVPEHLERAVKRALAVVPADRFASVAEFMAALDDANARAEPASANSIRRRWFAVGAAAAIVVLALVAAKPGAEWVRGLSSTQLDTSRFVVLPFLAEGDSGLAKRVTTGVHSELREWNGLGVAGEVEVRDAIASAGGGIGSLREAVAVARGLGAARLVWGTVHAEREQARVVAQVYDVERSSELAQRSFVGPTDSVGIGLYRSLASGVLTPGAVPAAFDDGYEGTRSYPALLSYRRGIIALGAFDLERARVELAEAVALDPDFGVAHLELARVHSWLEQDDAAAWHGHARRAVALREELRARDALRAEALLAYADKDYPGSCSRYRDLIAADTLDARAWYGLGECLHADATVVPDRRSRSGFSFRSSWHAAGNALIRAVQLEPGMHAVPHSRRFAQLFPTARNRVRLGKRVGTDSVSFGAVPHFADDTLGFTPYPIPNFDRENDALSRARREQALARNREVMLAFASSWARTYPRSSEAHTALAAIREQRGDLAGAAASLAAARRLARTGLDTLILIDAQVRVNYKHGDFAAARTLADSALKSFRETNERNWESIARMAGLTGAVSRLSQALQFFWAKYPEVKDLDQAVARSAGRALALAVLGICEGKPAAGERGLDALIRIHVQPDRYREIEEKVSAPILSFAHPCEAARVTSSQPGRESIAHAQDEFRRGDVRRARALLDSVAAARSYLRPGDLSPNLVAREALLRLAIGDTSKAVDLIDGTLSGLPGIPATTMFHPLETATLVRMMVVRAELAYMTGDSTTAGKWARAVAVLWAGADHPTMRQVVTRMSRLAATHKGK